MEPVRRASVLLTSCRWVGEVGLAFQLMPELASGLPPWNELEGSESGPWLVSPCAQQLLAPATRVTLGAIEQALDESALADGQEHLQRLVAELAQEAIQDLQTHAIPGLSVVAIARGIFLGGMALLSSLPLDLDRRLQRARERLQVLSAQERGRVAREVAGQLRAALVAAREGMGEDRSGREEMGLAEALLQDGLALALDPRARRAELVVAATGLSLAPRVVEQVLAAPREALERSETASAAQLLLRWDLASALLDRLALLTRGTGVWLSQEGPLPQSARGQLRVPRGEVDLGEMVVVALRLDGLQAEAAAVSDDALRGRVAVEQAWYELIGDRPQALHQRLAGFGLSVFTGVLDALEFAERATRTMSGPRTLQSGLDRPAVAISAEARVAAGVARGRVWGGTDGERVRIDGPTVTGAMVLASLKGWSARLLTGVPGASTRHPDAGLRCDFGTAAEALVEARRAGRQVVAVGQSGAPSSRSLPLRGWWEARGRRYVLLGRDEGGVGPVELLVLEAPQLAALLELDLQRAAQEPEELGTEAQDAVLALPGDWDRAPLRPRSHPADPLAAASFIDLPPDEEEGVEDERTEATEVDAKAAAAAAAAAAAPGPLFRERQVPDAALFDGALDDLEVPSWDATGFSLPEYSQEIQVSALDRGEAPARVGGYSLEVDDDYGFEEPAHDAHENTVDVDPIAHAAPRLRGSGLREPPPVHPPRSSLSDADFDVFAFPEGPVRARTSLPDVSGSWSQGEATADDEIFPLSDLGQPGDGRGGDEPELEVQDDDEEEILELAVDGELGSMSSTASIETAPPPARPEPAASTDRAEPERRRVAARASVHEVGVLFEGYVVVRDGSGSFIFGLRDGTQLRDAHSYETGGDADAAYRAFVRAKVAEGFVPRLDLWSPLPAEGQPSALDPQPLQRAYQAMFSG